MWPAVIRELYMEDQAAPSVPQGPRKSVGRAPAEEREARREDIAGGACESVGTAKKKMVARENLILCGVRGST